MAIRLTKIKSLADRIEIEWKVKAKKQGWINKSMSTPDEAQKGFYEALSELKDPLVTLCEVEELNQDLIKATGVSLSYKGGNSTLNAVITGTKTYENSGGCLNLNSPVKSAEDVTGEPTAAENLLTDGCVESIKKLMEETIAFMDSEPSSMEEEETTEEETTAGSSD